MPLSVPPAGVFLNAEWYATDMPRLMKYAARFRLDTERVFAYRLLRISRGDSIPLPGFDETQY
jgi:hypothetical protein